MKRNITDEIKEMFIQSRSWIELEVEYTKLTAAEKVIIMTSTFVLSAIIMLISMIVVFLLSFSLVDLFKLMMAPALAYLTVSGILILLAIGIYLLRAPLLFNPISRYMTRLLLSGNHTSEKE